MKTYLNVLLQLSRQPITANLSELLHQAHISIVFMTDLAVNIKWIGYMLMDTTIMFSAET
jgi:hypothetical protein